jgi:threonine aldolase
MIDLRSDTVTRPTEAMLEAMRSAEVGDDVFEDDPSAKALEAEVAALLGKEAALFVPSGTMANQLALRVLTRPGDEVIAHAKCHIYNYESGAPAALWGVSMRLIDSPDGTIPIDALKHAVRRDNNPHYAPTAAVALENTHNGCGGVVLSPEYCARVADFAAERGLAMHLDGARLWNAAAAEGLPEAHWARSFRTVSVCFSKGLGAPAGSALAGPAELIERARRFRKMLGGGMRQVGYLCAAAQHALRHHRARLVLDHQNAREFAEIIAGHEDIQVDLASVQTNIVYFEVAASHPMAAIDPHTETCSLVSALEARGVRLTGHGRRMRAVTHLDVAREAAVEAAHTILAALGAR